MSPAFRTIFYLVTPSYNQVDFIEQTITSVLNQKGVEVKYWVIDGGSKDGTKKLLQKYKQKLSWLSEPDQGQTDAINKGIKKFLELKKTGSKVGKKDNKTQHIFAYLNSDDFYLSGTLAKVAEAFRQSPHKSWLVGDCQIIDANNRPIQPVISLYKKIWRLALSWPTLLVCNPIPQPAVFIRWEAVQKVGLFNTKLKYVMDYEYWLRLWQRFGAPLQVSTQLAAFRIHGQSKGGTQFTKQFDEELQIAHHYTQNSAWLFLHSVHNEMIKTVYRLIK